MILEIPINLVVADDSFNARNIGNAEEYQKEIGKLAQSIKREGQDTPVLVRAEAGGKYYLLAGFRRYHAIKEVLEGATISAKVQDRAEVETKADELNSNLSDMFDNLRENVARKQLTTYDLAARCQKMQEKPFNLESKEIAKHLSAGLDADKEVGTAYVNTLARHCKQLIPVIRDGWRDGLVTFNKMVAGGVAALDKDEQKAWWEEHCGGTAPGTGASADGKGKGKGKGKDAAGVKRASAKNLEAALKAVGTADGCSDDYRKGVVDALRFAAGASKVIKGVYDPEEEKARKAQEEKEEKEEAARVAREAKEKKEAKEGKNAA